ncbi:Tert [Columba guinea]|nr:Tert [Columba guinea]
MAGAKPFAAVLAALRGCYAEVTPLETFIQRLRESGAGEAELSSQSEVITRVIQRLCEKRKKNVLAYGYSLLDENSSDFHIMPSSNIYSYLPNTATETLLHSSCDGKKFVAGESSFLRGVQSNKPLKSRNEMQAESCRKGVEMHTYKSQLDSVQINPLEGISSECRRRESPLAHLAKKLPNTLLRSAVYIDRKLLLYSRRSFQECFPKSFLLNRLQGCQAGGRRLIETIFLRQNLLEQKHRQNRPHRIWRKKRLPKRYWQMRHTFQKLLTNHGKCPYLVILKKNCPVWISETSVRKAELPCWAALPGETEVREEAEQFGKEPAKHVTSSRCKSGCTDVTDNLRAPLAKSVGGESRSGERNPGEVCDSALRALLKQHSSHWQVYIFVRECLERVVPAELWGSNHNKCRFLKNVKAFISMGKFAKLSLRELMWKMRVNDCMWLRLVKGDHFVPAYEHCFREELLAKFLYWLMDTYVVELLRSFFYITETMFQKNMLFYYRKFIWGKLQNIGIRNHFAQVHLRALSSEEIEAVRQKKYILVASKLRFIPKVNGLRPIVKMHHYNTRLKNLFSVLNYERTINTSFIGSSVFGKDDIYKAWKKFVTKVLESGGEIPHFYYVKADVSRAYDTIPHNKLVEVISRILKPEKRTVYCIRRYAVIMITTSGRARRLYRRHSLTFNETSSSLFNFFLHMISNNILEIGNRYYLQCCGIPQGSILSTLLCSLCYGDMENKLLCGVQQDGTLATGIPEYGFLINPHKTVVNFPVDDIPGCSKFKQLPDCRLVPWCGLLLDIQTLEVYCDYSRSTALEQFSLISTRFFYCRLTGVTLGNKGASGMFPSEAAEWLCYHAFTVKLANHKVIYKCLLKPIKACKMQLFRKIPKDTMALLKTVTEPSLCQDFKAILD